MNRGVAGVDRTIAFALGVALVTGGLVCVAWKRHWPFATDWLNHADRDWYSRAPDQRWWHLALAVVAVLAFLLGLLLVLSNFSRRRTNTLRLAGSDVDGVLSVDLNPLASAIAAEVRTYPGIHTARAKAVQDRGLPTIVLRMIVDPHVEIHTVIAKAERTASEIAVAVDGATVATQIFVEYDKPVHVA